MASIGTEDTNKNDHEFDQNPLMAVYNPQPPAAEQPARFYWQEPWQGTTSDVQAAFEG